MNTYASTANQEISKTDPRIKQIDAKIRKEEFRHDALIEILHTAQNAFGYLPLHVLNYIAKQLHLPPSRVFATVTFYHFFSLKSKGEHSCIICMGTACYVKGAQAIIDKIEKDMGIKPGEVSADGKLGVQTARCIGACGLAPAVVIDDEVVAKSTGEIIITKLNEKLN